MCEPIGAYASMLEHMRELMRAQSHMREDMRAYASIRQHTQAYPSIFEHTPAYASTFVEHIRASRHRHIDILAWTRAFHARSWVGLGSAASSKLAEKDLVAAC